MEYIVTWVIAGDRRDSRTDFARFTLVATDDDRAMLHARDIVRNRMSKLESALDGRAIALCIQVWRAQSVGEVDLKEKAA